MLKRFFPLIVLAQALFAAGCAGLYFHDAGQPAGPPRRYTLADWPYREYWQGVVFNGEKIGFSRLAVEPLGAERYRLRSEAAFRLRFLGIDKRVNLKALDEVDSELALLRFIYDYDLDGHRLRLDGRVDGDVLHVAITSAGNTTIERYPLHERVHPASAIALYPLRYGLALGARYRYLIYDGQTQALAEVEQRVEAYERSELFTGTAYRLTTMLHGQRTRSWMDARGRPLLEIALNGVLISALEDERVAKHDLIAASLNKRESLLDYSLVRLSTPLSSPRRARRLTLVLTGLAQAPPSDNRQQCVVEDVAFRCEIRARDPGANRAQTTPDADMARYLEPSVVVPSHDPRMRALAREIASGEDRARARIARILDWLQRNIRKEAVDVFSALDVLEGRRAECQGHAYLYAALARALGLPTRVVNGLVYSEELGGFLYHSWAETHVGGAWLAVDPTFGQLPADATHLKLIEGERLAELMPLVDLIGKIRIEVRFYESAS